MDKAFEDLRVRDVMSRDVVTADADDLVREWAGDPHLHSIPVLDKGKLAGMIDYRRLMRSRLDIVDAKLRNFAVMPPLFSPDDSLIEASKKLLESEFRAAPVMRKGKLAGILGLRDIATAVAMHREFSPKRASDMMSIDFVSVRPEETLGRAMDLMIKQNISRLPVIEGEGIAGVVAFRDVLDKALRPKKREKTGLATVKPTKSVGITKTAVTDLPVRGFMSRPAVTVESNATLDVIYEKTSRFDISDVVVTRAGRPVGIITLRDICRNIADLPLAERTIAFTFSGIRLYFDDQEYIRRDVEALYRKTLHPIEAVDFHVKKHDSAGRTKYSVTAKVRTDYGFFTASATAWNVIQGFEECIKELERIIEDKKERTREIGRSLKKRFKSYEVG